MLQKPLIPSENKMNCPKIQTYHAVSRITYSRFQTCHHNDPSEANLSVPPLCAPAFLSLLCNVHRSAAADKTFITTTKNVAEHCGIAADVDFG